VLLLILILAAPPAACDADGLKKVEAVLSQVQVEHQQHLAFAGVREACTLHPALDQAAQASYNFAPQEAALMEARAVAAAPELWMAACPGGPRLVAQLIALAPNQRAAPLYEGCNLKRFGISAAAYLQPKPSLLGILLAHQVHPFEAQAPHLIPALLGLAVPVDPSVTRPALKPFIALPPEAP